MPACDTSRCRFSQYPPRTTFSTGKKRSGVWYVRSAAIILRTAKGLLWCGYLGIEYGAVSPVRTALGGVSKAPWCLHPNRDPSGSSTSADNEEAAGVGGCMRGRRSLLLTRKALNWATSPRCSRQLILVPSCVMITACNCGYVPPSKFTTRNRYRCQLHRSLPTCSPG